MSELSQDRQNALELARLEGWRVERDGKRWKFTKPDPHLSATFDAFRLSHSAMGMRAVFGKIETYNEALRSAVVEVQNKARMDWLKEAHPRLYATITEGGGA